MKKPQWISIGVAVFLVIIILAFGRTVAEKNPAVTEGQTVHDDHQHEESTRLLTTDSILLAARKQLSNEQVTRITQLENSITRGDVVVQKLAVYHQLSHFWGDTIRSFAPYAWYEAEAARLENSEKTLTFAARLMLENLQEEEDPSLRQWEALQAKDLFERSLKLNPDNDSSKVGIGATYLFGGISDQPMTGINLIREVVQKDSNNVYAQLTLAKGALVSGQLDRAVSRLELVNRIDPSNVECILMLADLAERQEKKKDAAGWYEKSLQYIGREDVKTEIRKRITELRK